MKTLSEIKDEVGANWLFNEGSYVGEIANRIAEVYAEECLIESKEIISSLKGEIEELKSEIVVLKSQRQ